MFISLKPTLYFITVKIIYMWFYTSTDLCIYHAFLNTISVSTVQPLAFS
jgi:hypothetical protein